MKRILILLAVFCFQNILFAQIDKSEELKTLFESEEYDKIIKEYSKDREQLSAKSIYFIGMAHYMKEEDERCIEMMNLSIQKDDTYPDPFFIKGMTLNYLGKFNEAIATFEQAINIYPDKSDYFSGLGDSYFSIEEYDKALSAYQESIRKDDPVERPFTMIPQIYSAQGKNVEALEAFYTAKQNISKEGNSYINILYNIGLSELLQDNYDKAESAFKELIELYPEDYSSYAKLIQIYYAKKEYDKATPYRKSLYEAYDKEALPDNLKEMFCFDQFDWRDKLIQVFERFEEKEGELYYKHIFYVVNQQDELEFKLQTENSPISVELGGPKYLIGMEKDGEHSTFNYGFDEDFEYDDLKETIIEILEDRIKPTTTSRKNKD